MLVVEIREPVALPAESSDVSHVFDLELLIASPTHRCCVSFLKGLFASFLVLGLGGITLGSSFAFCFSLYLACFFALCTSIDQRLAGEVSTTDIAKSLENDFRRWHPAALALIPGLLLLLSMNLQTLCTALTNLIEVAGIACGVPFLILGSIRLAEGQNNAVAHLKLGAISVVSGIALSITFGGMTSKFTEANAFSAPNYFGDTISAIYAPGLVIDSTFH